MAGEAVPFPFYMVPFYKALLIDDDPTANFLNEIWVRRTALAEGVITFVDPEAALDFCEKNIVVMQHESSLPILLLLDINMPTINGFEFLDKLCQQMNVEALGLTIFMLSSSFAQKDIEKAGHYPIAGYLEKPLSYENVDRITQRLAG